jgi:adenosine kinase
MSGPELADGISGASIVICNDYECELIREKTGLDEAAMLEMADLLVVTRGERGSTVMDGDGTIHVAAVPPVQIVDPTGVGDAYRAGFMKGLALGADPPVCARIGSVAATYALEHLGGQSHAYTLDDFARRYARHFGALDLDPGR